MQTRSSDEISVRPSACLSVGPSVKRVDVITDVMSENRLKSAFSKDKTKEKSVQIFIPCEGPFTVVLLEKEW